MRKNKKGQGSTMLLIGITCIIGMVLLTVLFGFLNNTSLKTETVVNETITLQNSTRVDLANYWVIGVTEVYSTENVTKVLLSTGNYTVSDLNNELVKAGITLTDATYDGNASYVSYTYYPAGYIESSTTRGLLALTPVLFALVILVFVAGFVVMKKQ